MLPRSSSAPPAPNLTVLQRYRTRWNANIVLKPMFLGGIMVASGNKP